MWDALGFYRLGPERRAASWGDDKIGQPERREREEMGGNTDICDMFNAQYNSSSHLYRWPPPVKRAAVEWITSMKCVTGLQSSGDTGNNQTISSKNSSQDQRDSNKC